MDDKQRKLFKVLKSIKDSHVEISVASLYPDSRIESYDHLQRECNIVRQKLTTKEELEAYKALQHELVEGILNDVLVLIDGYGELDDSFDLVDKKKQTNH